MTSQHSTLGRRTFIQAGAAAGAGVALAGFPSGSPASAQSGPRSLVCISLDGGADSCNMLIPAALDQQGSTYDVYRRTRGVFAVPSSDVLEIGNGDFGLHPDMPGIAAIADQGHMATVANVGPLRLPITQADYQARRALPQSLFAHDAQQKLWQTGRTVLAESTGWGGAVAASFDAASDLAPAFSTNGSNVWQASPKIGYSRISPTIRVERLLGYDSSLRSWIPSFEGVESVMQKGIELAAGSSSAFNRAASAATAQSIFTTNALQEATLDNDANAVGMDDIGQNRLGLQLRLVARLIKNREQLGMDRQMFFVRMGGWDTHGGQAERLPVLLQEFDEAVSSFHGAMTQLGTQNSVTAFTSTDFGRTLTSNGDGTDHGWGGHAFVFGGAVAAGRYGTFPSYSIENNPDDIGTDNGFAGRLIPTTSVSQYGATMARWMGLTESEIDMAFPDLTNFADRDLAFLT